MTSPALLVLCFTLVCSISTTALENTADHDDKLTSMKQPPEATELKTDMELWTKNLYRNYINYDENDYNIAIVKSKYNRMNLGITDRGIRIFDFKAADSKSKDVKRNILTEAPKLDLNASGKKFDEIYEGNAMEHNYEESKKKVKSLQIMDLKEDIKESKRRIKRDDEDNCEFFTYNPKQQGQFIMHPHRKDSKTYNNNSNCVIQINATSDDMVIELTFVDMFRIESHPECAYDYLEIRDGLFGYSKLIDKVCGTAFPRQMTTSGPNAWLKFRSDDTIEYEGFKIKVNFKQASSHRIPPACFVTLAEEYGEIDSKDISHECLSGSSQAVDVLWTIKVPEDRKIYLNFSKFSLAKPNECHENLIEVFGSVLELSSRLAYFCGTVSNSVSTKGDGEQSNIMHIRLYYTKAAKHGTFFAAYFNAYRTLDTTKEEKCLPTEFDCEDNTCIAPVLKCDNVAHCRLKNDEDEKCNDKAASAITQTHILVILVIFCLILSSMSFVFLFKCIRKLYQDHKIIKEHLRQSCEDRLDTLSHLTLDPKRLQRDSQPRASLERENHTNEMYKQQRSLSKHMASSIDSSDYIHETHLDLEDEPWRREVESVPVEQEVRIERNGRTRRSDMSRKEESIRSRTKESEKEEVRPKKEIRDVSVGAPDTKESGCQTRESLFQTDPPPSSDGSGTGSNSRGFSTFGYSGATIARPTPPKTAEITIELLKQVPPQETKPQKKIDRRPMSTETTRSAPDVIIVSKPIR